MILNIVTVATLSAAIVAYTISLVLFTRELRVLKYQLAELEKSVQLNEQYPVDLYWLEDRLTQFNEQGWEDMRVSMDREHSKFIDFMLKMIETSLHQSEPDIPSVEDVGDGPRAPGGFEMIQAVGSSGVSYRGTIDSQYVSITMTDVPDYAPFGDRNSIELPGLPDDMSVSEVSVVIGTVIARVETLLHEIKEHGFKPSEEELEEFWSTIAEID